MLQPPELKKAQGFRDDYILDRGLFVNTETGQDEWRPITKTDPFPNRQDICSWSSKLK
jgi:DNA (cytosine-5)-methyltransferase 1